MTEKNDEKLIKLCEEIGMTLHKAYKIISLTKIIPEIRNELTFDHLGRYGKGEYSITIAPYLLNLSPKHQLEVYLFAMSEPKIYKEIKKFAQQIREREERQKIIEKYGNIKRNITTKKKIEEAESLGFKAVKEDYQIEYEIPLKFKKLKFSIFLTEKKIQQISSLDENEKKRMWIDVKKSLEDVVKGVKEFEVNDQP